MLGPDYRHSGRALSLKTCFKHSRCEQSICKHIISHIAAMRLLSVGGNDELGYCWPIAGCSPRHFASSAAQLRGLVWEVSSSAQGVEYRCHLCALKVYWHSAASQCPVLVVHDALKYYQEV
mmetsp:Transcript_32013/g.38759  ORF Transcript_32013/g.38759 Transcript_32013/m.38759 type:complete len:121 (-) Transcript_32013:1661-2023(-)